MGWKDRECHTGQLNEPFLPVDVSDPMLRARLGGLALEPLLPPKDLVPNKIERPWLDIFNDLFFGRGERLEFKYRPHIDPDKAKRHIQCLMQSFAIKHEYKMSAVTFLLQKWCEDITERGNSIINGTTSIAAFNS